MKNWIKAHNSINQELKYVWMIGNLFVFLFAARELFYVLSALRAIEIVSEDTVRMLVSLLSLQTGIVILSFLRIVWLSGKFEISQTSFFLSGLMCSVLIFIYLADSVQLWSLILPDPNKLRFEIYDLKRADGLSFISPFYLIFALLKLIGTAIRFFRQDGLRQI